MACNRRGLSGPRSPFTSGRNPFGELPFVEEFSMSRPSQANPLADPTQDPQVRAAARQLVGAVRRARGSDALSKEAFEASLLHLGELRGRPLAHPLLSGGVGRGARVRLADGRLVLDLVSGIGPYVFGHDDQDLLETAAVAAASDVAYQGHVLPGPEYYRLSERLLRHAGERLAHVWLSLSGSMANENALKLILQRRAPADRLLAFDRAFHGRTLAMAIPGAVALRSGLHAMQAFVAWDGDAERTAAIIEAALEEGVLVQPAGSAPTKIRLLPPLNLTDEELDSGFAAIERAMRGVGPPGVGR